MIEYEIVDSQADMGDWGWYNTLSDYPMAYLWCEV